MLSQVVLLQTPQCEAATYQTNAVQSRGRKQTPHSLSHSLSLLSHSLSATKKKKKKKKNRTAGMAISCPEAATDLTTAPSSREHSLFNTDTANANRTLSFSTVKLPHLTDFLHDLQTGPNPLDHNPFYRPSDGFYISNTDVILRHILFDLSSPPHSAAYHRAGPRNRVFFDPCRTRAAIVTCGGLCPGLNTVIRELVVALWDLYGVRQIFGVKAGYRGFYSSEPVELNPKLVHSWHKMGGTGLETSRGGFDLHKIVDAIRDRGFNQVFFSLLSSLILHDSIIYVQFLSFDFTFDDHQWGPQPLKFMELCFLWCVFNLGKGFFGLT